MVCFVFICLEVLDLGPDDDTHAKHVITTLACSFPILHICRYTLPISRWLSWASI